MNIFVGVLHTYENEYFQCLESIRSQVKSNYELFEFKNLKNKQAHDSLYSSFMNRRDEFDIMMKIDSDMILKRNTVFKEVSDVFISNEKIDRLYVAVYDFFTDKLIMGLNSYRNTVEWPINTREDLFVDTRPIATGTKIKDYNNLAPLALHSPNPSPFQAFHFGVHKALKVIQPGRDNYHIAGGKRHWSNILALKNSYARKGNILRGYALLGAEFGLASQILPKHLDFNDKKLHHQFNKFSGIDQRTLNKLIHFYSRKNFWWLPTSIRTILLRQFRKSKRLIS